MWKKIITICAGVLLIGSLDVSPVQAEVDPPITVQTPASEIRSVLLRASAVNGRVLKDSTSESITIDDLSVNDARLGKMTDLLYGGTSSALRLKIIMVPVDEKSTNVSMVIQLIARYGAPAEGVIATSGTQSGAYLDNYVNTNYVNLYRTFNTYYAYGFDVSKNKIINIVQSGSPAERSGLQVGDKILRINGKKADKLNQIEFDRLTVNPYTPVYLELSVSRNGETFDLNMTSEKTKYSLYDQLKQRIVSPF